MHYNSLSGKSCGQMIEEQYPACRSFLDHDTWSKITALCADDNLVRTFPDTLSLRKSELGLPDFLPELARLESMINDVKLAQEEIPTDVESVIVNPSLRLLELSYKNLLYLLDEGRDRPAAPEIGSDVILAWRHPRTGDLWRRSASQEDLLVLKVVVEGIDPRQVAATGNVPLAAIDAAIVRAAERGMVLIPRSRIRRNPLFSSATAETEPYLAALSFTLQWHITQACDLHCKHCYDRTRRSPLRFRQALKILDDFYSFCRDRHVQGHVSFSGGNPLLYPHFFQLYEAARDRGFGTMVLGNPAPREEIERLLSIQRPEFFQVSLEGMPEHNDSMRGPGHFERVMEFLDLLRELGVYSMVMLTLTKENVRQVLPLAELLRGRADLFTFNRLSQVGEGAALQLPSQDEYTAFLKKYLDASNINPVLALKDNLLNLIRHKEGVELFGGCTGFGCGAAFNFMAVLPDGEVHACRKFPSLIGNVFKQSIDKIYDSPQAQRFRSGSTACRSCSIHHVCGGCLAVTYSQGLDPCEARDPYCFA